MYQFLVPIGFGEEGRIALGWGEQESEDGQKWVLLSAPRAWGQGALFSSGLWLTGKAGQFT